MEKKRKEKKRNKIGYKLFRNYTKVKEMYLFQTAFSYITSFFF